MQKRHTFLDRILKKNTKSSELYIRFSMNNVSLYCFINESNPIFFPMARLATSILGVTEATKKS
jgi:hypothetical protein